MPFNRSFARGWPHTLYNDSSKAKCWKNPCLCHWDNDMFWRKQKIDFRTRIELILWMYILYKLFLTLALQQFVAFSHFHFFSSLCFWQLHKNREATPQFGSDLPLQTRMLLTPTGPGASFPAYSHVFCSEIEINDSWLAQIQLSPMNEAIIASSKELWELQMSLLRLADFGIVKCYRAIECWYSDIFQLKKPANFDFPILGSATGRGYSRDSGCGESPSNSASKRYEHVYRCVHQCVMLCLTFFK